LGTLALTVQNQLRSSSAVVPSNVRLLVYLSLRNPRFYEVLPRPGYLSIPFVTAGEGEVSVTEPISGDQVVVPPHELTAQEDDVQKDQPCWITPGRKFEHVISDVVEVCRRYRKMEDDLVSTIIHVKPYWEFNNMFAAWAGHLNFRLFFDTPATVQLIKVDEGLPVAPTEDNVVPPTVDLQGYPPLELTHTVGAREWVTISIPFNTLFNILPCKDDTFNEVVSYHSYLECSATPSVVYVAAGDDFRYYMPYFGANHRRNNTPLVRPWLKSYYKPAVAVKKTMVHDFVA